MSILGMEGDRRMLNHGGHTISVLMGSRWVEMGLTGLLVAYQGAYLNRSPVVDIF